MLDDKDTPPTPQSFTETPGPTMDQMHRLSAIQCFSLFFTSMIWEFLVNRTNQYAAYKKTSHTKSRSLYKNWKPVTISEMKAFVGTILNMGLIQVSKIRDYWSTHYTCNIPFFRQTFSRDRFLQIFGMLHVGDIQSRAKEKKITPFIDLMSPIIQDNYILGQHIAVDESVISFKGRVSFKQYLKGKPNPWGVKAYVLSDSLTGYMHKLQMYYGKDTPLIDRPELQHTVKVVLTLVHHLRDKGYDLYTDRFYTSPCLADELTKLGITLTGTIMSNKKGLPLKVKQKIKQKKGDVSSFRYDKKMVVSWTDKRNIFMLSTKYSNEVIDVPTRLVHTLIVNF